MQCLNRDVIRLFTLFCGMGSSLHRCSNRIPWILQAPCSQCSQTHNAHKRTILTTLTKLTTLTITTKSSQSSVFSLQWSVQWRSRVRLSAPERHRCPNPDRFRAVGEPRASRLAIAEPPIDFNPTTFREEPVITASNNVLQRHTPPYKAHQRRIKGPNRLTYYIISARIFFLHPLQNWKKYGIT